MKNSKNQLLLLSALSLCWPTAAAFLISAASYYNESKYNSMLFCVALFIFLLGLPVISFFNVKNSEVVK